MNCRDCLHFKACYEMATAFGLEEFNTLFANQCKDFTDRSEWVHLPYKVREQEIKSKAYKEFTDMVKKNIKEVWNYDNGTCSCVLVLTKDIDKILKEMVSRND